MISPELLRRYPYFADVSEESLKRVAMISEEQTVAAGQAYRFHTGPGAEPATAPVESS